MIDAWGANQQHNDQRFGEIVAALSLLLEPGQVTEVRALEATTASNRNWPATVSGYFCSWERLADAVLSEIINAKGIYVVANVVDPALIARAENRIRVVRHDPTTADHDIVRRRWLMLDFDPVRAAGISSTEIEHSQALQLAHDVAHALSSESWPWPVISDSGNGAHLMYRVDLPADDGGLVERCLAALAARFSNSAVQIDQSVFNPARIWKLPGTWAAKGDSTLDRPHRLAKVLWAPPVPIVVPIDLLTALAEHAPKRTQRERPVQAHVSDRRPRFDVAGWIARHNLEVLGPDPWQGGLRWVFRVCPWNQEHTNRSAFLIQFSNGGISAGCHHAGCAGKGWHDLRDLVEPGWRTGRHPDLAAVLPLQLPQAIHREFIQSSRKPRRRSR